MLYKYLNSSTSEQHRCWHSFKVCFTKLSFCIPESPAWNLRKFMDFHEVSTQNCPHLYAIQCCEIYLAAVYCFIYSWQHFGLTMFSLNLLILLFKHTVPICGILRRIYFRPGTLKVLLLWSPSGVWPLVMQPCNEFLKTKQTNMLNTDTLWLWLSTWQWQTFSSVHSQIIIGAWHSMITFSSNGLLPRMLVLCPAGTCVCVCVCVCIRFYGAYDYSGLVCQASRSILYWAWGELLNLEKKPENLLFLIHATATHITGRRDQARALRSISNWP